MDFRRIKWPLIGSGVLLLFGVGLMAFGTLVGVSSSSTLRNGVEVRMTAAGFPSGVSASLGSTSATAGGRTVTVDDAGISVDNQRVHTFAESPEDRVSVVTVDVRGGDVSILLDDRPLDTQSP